MLKKLQKIFFAKPALIKFIFFLALAAASSLVFTQKAYAQCEDVCGGDSGSTPACLRCLDEQSSSDDIIGRINPPAGVAEYQEAVQAQDGSIGLIIFLSNIIRFITIVAGIWTMINFILAGWTYITSSGDASAHEKASQQMINSIIGLLIVALAYTIAGALGWLIFGNARFIIDPTLTTINDL